MEMKKGPAAESALYTFLQTFQISIKKYLVKLLKLDAEYAHFYENCTSHYTKSTNCTFKSIYILKITCYKRIWV